MFRDPLDGLQDSALGHTHSEDSSQRGREDTRPAREGEDAGRVWSNLCPHEGHEEHTPTPHKSECAAPLGEENGSRLNTCVQTVQAQ